MYIPSEIDGPNLLSAYLRLDVETLESIINDDRCIIDCRSFETKIESLRKCHAAKFHFLQFYLPKKNPKLGHRIVYKVNNKEYRNVLKVLKFNLYSIYTPLEYVHGFIPKKDTLSNARNHIGKKYLLKLDVKDFFHSISSDKVKEAFLSLNFIEPVAIQLTKVCTLRGILPQGFSTSPVLANVVMTQVDKVIHQYCKGQNACYTRYADDISISYDSAEISVDFIADLIGKIGLKLNMSKVRLFKRGQNQYVTGLSVADDSYPRIPKKTKQNIRQKIYYINKFGLKSHVLRVNDWDNDHDKDEVDKEVVKERNRLRGTIDYIHYVEPILAKKLWRCIKCKDGHILKMAVEQSCYLDSDKTLKTCSSAPAARVVR